MLIIFRSSTKSQNNDFYNIFINLIVDNLSFDHRFFVIFVQFLFCLLFISKQNCKLKGNEFLIVVYIVAASPKRIKTSISSSSINKYNRIYETHINRTQTNMTIQKKNYIATHSYKYIYVYIKLIRDIFTRW